MTNHKIQFVGTSCGQHGNYTFYKAFKYSLHGKEKILTLGEFFFVKFWEGEDIISIGEPQLIWEDKNSGQFLVSLRVYFLPENTPEGRCEEHGEDEVVSLSEKVILRADDVISIMRGASELKWETGLKGVYDAESNDEIGYSSSYFSPVTQSIDIRDVIEEKKIIGDVVKSNNLHVIVLSYDSYCRIRALLKRLEGIENEVMKSKIVRALGGFVVPSRKTRLLFCRDIFDYPELEGHELLCNHLAPKLQGRPIKKGIKRTDSESDSSDSSEDQISPPKQKPSLLIKSTTAIPGLTAKPNINKVHTSLKKNSPNLLSCHMKSEFSTPALDRLIEVDFMSKLYKFMKDRNTAITRLPYIGSKQLNVFELFTRVQQLGGYETVNQKKMWKELYEELAGKVENASQNSTQNSSSNVTNLKKHYERLLLPYENFLLQEQRRILGIDSTKFNVKLPKSPSILPKLAPSSSKSSNKSTSPSLSKYQQLSSNESAEPLVKVETSVPSVSILQQPTPTSGSETAIGASFEVADGGSTTITLVPSDEQASPTAADAQQFNPLVENLVSHYSKASVNPLPPTSVLSSSFPDLTVPKLVMKKDANISNELSKRPEITITPIPRSFGSLLPGTDSSVSSLQLADLMNFNLNSTLGVSALQDLAKIAERYDTAATSNLVGLDSYFSTLKPPPSKKRKPESSSSRVNGARSVPDDSSELNSKPPGSYTSRSIYPVPDNFSIDLMRQMSNLEADANLLLPAHQSTKSINSLASLLPQTSIFPAPAPAAHQQSACTSQKPQVDMSKPEPVFQSLSAYSQSKNVYGKPTAHLSSEPFRGSSQDSGASTKSSEIEILDLRIPNENKAKVQRTKSDTCVDIDLLDLRTRRDITVSAISKSSPNNRSKILPQMNIDISSSKSSPLEGSSSNSLIPGTNFNSGCASLMSGFTPQAVSSLNNLGIAHPSVLQYLMSSGLKSSPGGISSMFPTLDASSLASYYSLLSPGLLESTNQAPNSRSSSNSVLASAQQAATAAQLAQLNSLNISGFSNATSDAMASLGIYKNYLPQGSLPPHFLSSFLSPGGQVPSTSK